LRALRSLVMTEQQLLAAGITPIDSTQRYPVLHAPGEIGLPMLVIENPLGRTVVALQGAHVVAFQPAGGREMLWLSPKTALRKGTAIRGGIPLCLPWFGAGPDGKSAHGFARTATWDVASAERQPDGSTRLVLELSGDATPHPLWPHPFRFRLEIESGSALKLALSVENRGESPAPLTFAFHTYFALPDVAKARVSGLDGTTYLDKTDNNARKTQVGDVTISDFTDRIYLDVPDRQTIATGNGEVTVESKSRCAIVWNAWNNDAKMPDVGEGNHVGYLCVERGDVADCAVTLPGGGSYASWMTLATG
jgi:glucose-6-phosphate 1-epimerase